MVEQIQDQLFGNAKKFAKRFDSSGLSIGDLRGEGGLVNEAV